jgi:hypothetical protein
MRLEIEDYRATVPHAGFGLAPAFRRGTLAYVTGLSNVPRRDPLPENAGKHAVLIAARPA